MTTFLIAIGIIAVLSFIRTLGYHRVIADLEKRIDRLEDIRRPD